MKHSIPVKFLAILLCALTLLGALGSAAAILVMTEMDLYNLTVAQVKEERFHNMGESFAQSIAQDYANHNLGGSPTELINNVTISPFIYWFNNVFDARQVGYRLLDENGNVLDQMNPEFAQNKKVSSYTFPVEGEYMRLVSTYPKPNMEGLEVSDLPYVQNNVPAEGADIYELSFEYKNGNGHNILPSDVPAAIAYYDQSGNLVIQFLRGMESITPDVPLTHLKAWDINDELLYEVSCASGVGYLTPTPDGTYFFSATVTPETESILNGETTVFVDDINPGGHGIYGYNIIYTNGYGHDMFSRKMIGTGYRPTDDELVINLNYRAEEPYLDTPVQSLILYSMDEEVIYHAHNPGVLGWFIESENGYAFTFAPTSTDIPAEEPYLYDAIPADGCDVYGLSYGTADSSSGVGSMDPIGFLYYGENHRVMFRSYDPGLVEIEISGVTLTSITFLDENDQPIYEATDPNGVGFFNQDGTNKDVFHSMLTTDTQARGEILDSEGNVLLEKSLTPSGETTAAAEVWTAYFLDANRSVLYQAASFDTNLGTFSYDGEGYAHLTIDLSGPTSYTVNGQLPPGQVCGVTLYGLEGQTIYEGFNAEGLGAISFGESQSDIFFTSNEPDPAPVATPAAASVSYDGIAPIEQVVEEVENTVPGVTEVPADPTAPSVYETIDPTVEATEASLTATTPTTGATVPAVTEVPAEPTVPPTAAQMTEATEETVAVATEPVMAEAFRTSPNTYEYYDSETEQWMVAEVVYEELPPWTVEIHLLPGAYTHEAVYELLEILQLFRYQLFFVLAISGLLFAMLFVYLCCTAGHKPGSTEVHAAGLNCLPLDLYTGLAVGAVCLIAVLGAEGANHLLDQKMEVGFIFAICMAYLGCLVAVGFLYGLVAQFKTPRRFWLKNTLCARALRLTIRFAKWLETWLSRKGFPFIGRFIRKTWHFSIKAVLWTYRTCEKIILWLCARVGKVFHWVGKKVKRFLSLLPLTWQWLLAGFMVIFVLLIAIDGFKDGNDVALPLGLVIAIGAVVYASHCFGVLSESAKRMGKGDLDTKVNDKLLVGCFEDFASDLNALADVAVVAAQKQLKSERMKTELITNVSHDIKTPLTSIINYVDLLQKPHTPEQQEQYLEVLDRQSQRLKKLIDDLMDMSKASTGNMSVDIIRLDAIESVNQALGEFADKLDRAQLTPVFRHAEDTAPILADGRLVWRVMSNILSNAVKYAMPGTRLYIDLMTLEGKVVISVKNISREELNMDAEELMERFVRGDDSRNTEGSGLGLNIAKSLMELQKGQLQLLVDGDLFKVTLIFPSV